MGPGFHCPEGLPRFREGKYPVDDRLHSGLRQPAIHRNDELMERVRSKMVPFYYDAKKYDTYLQQLGVKYGAGSP